VMPQVWEVDDLRASGIHVSGCSCTQHIMRHMAEGIQMHLDGYGLLHAARLGTKKECENALYSNTFKGVRTRIEKGPELFWELVFFRFGNFVWICVSARFPCYLHHFGAGSCHFYCLCNMLELEPLIFHIEFAAICNILELEAAVSTVFAALLSSNLSFWMEFATCCCSNCSCNMVFCN